MSLYERQFWPNGRSSEVRFLVELETLPSGNSAVLIHRSDGQIKDPIVVLKGFPLEIAVECLDGVTTVRMTRLQEQKL